MQVKQKFREVSTQEGLKDPRRITRSAQEEDHHRVISARSASAIWLEETHWTSKNHLAQNDRWGHPAPELWGPHGMEEG